MIEFVLDNRSKVNTYVQIIQQVKQALRVGLLTPGDQLPKVRDVAQTLAINPNTVLKAYRELVLEGLAEGRPGVGTFISRTLAGNSLAHQAQLREELVVWLRKAQTAGLTGEDVTALVETTTRTLRQTDALRAEHARQPEDAPRPDGARPELGAEKV
jgi:GntR family transcriptional regulator